MAKLNLTNEHNHQIQEGNHMKELFKEAEEKLYRKGYYIDNMADFENEFEVSNGDGKILIDHLSLAQLKQLSNIL